MRNGSTLKARKSLTGFSIAAAAVLLLAGCSSSSSSSSAAAPTTSSSAANPASGKNVILLTVSQSCDYCATHTKAFLKVAQAAGINVKTVVNEFNAADQANQVTQAIAAKPDAIVLWPADATAIVPSLLKIKQAGIPVVVTNSMPQSTDNSLFAAYTGPNDYQNGVSAAQAMIKGFAAKGFGTVGNIIVVTGVPGTPPAIQRLKGLQETLRKEAPGIKVLGTQPGDWDQTKATTATANLLTQFSGKGIKGVYAQADNMLAGSLAALTRAKVNPASVVTVGSNCSIEGYNAIGQGNQYGTVLQSPIADGEAAAQALIKLLGGVSQDHIQYIPAEVITKNNLADCAAAVGK
jgi:ribose transport system substrate-binding protein